MPRDVKMPDPLTLKLNMNYSTGLREDMCDFDFDDSYIPKHVLGFSINYKLTQKRIFRFLHDQPFRSQLRSWENLDKDEQAAAEFNIQVLKKTQQTIFEEEEDKGKGKKAKRAAVPSKAAQKVTPPSNAKKRAASKSSAGGTQKKVKANILSFDVDDGRRHYASRNDDTEDSSEEESSDSEASGVECERKQPSKDSWTAEEDKKLIAAAKKKTAWTYVAKNAFNYTRSASACYQRYRKVS